MADLAQGSVFQMTISSVLTAIAEVVSIDGPSSQRDDIDVSHLGSGVQRDFLPGLIDPGEVNLELNYDPNGSTHQAITDQFVLTSLVACKAIWSDATEIPCSCYIKSFKPNASVGDKMKATVGIKVADAITWPT